MTVTDECIEALRKEAAELRREVARLRAEKQGASTDSVAADGRRTDERRTVDR